jgi:hypothetical protein
MYRIFPLILFVVGLTLCGQVQAFGGDNDARDLGASNAAATAELPAALLALEPLEEEILTTTAADEVRGEWILTLDFPLVATQIEGWGTFHTRILTLAGGYWAGTPITVQLRIGK